MHENSLAVGADRLISMAIAMLFALVLSACGGSGPSTSERTANQDGATLTANRLAARQGLFFVAGSVGGPGSLDGTGPSARFDHPQGIVSSAQGNLYIADSGNHTIRKITPAGVVTTVAGKSGAAGSVDGYGFDARFAGLRYIAVDDDENLYVTDRNSIRSITPQGMVTTLAGVADTPGSADGVGLAARFDAPAGIAVDAGRNLYVADMGNNTIRKIAANGMVSTLAGMPGAVGSADGVGTAARFNKPQGITLDAAGMLYVADRDNYVIRRVTPAGAVGTIAGTPGINGSSDGAGAAAQFFAPQSVAADAEGNLFVADAFLFPRMCQCGANGLIRRIAPNGEVSTLAGTSKISGSEDGTGPAARFDLPLGITVTPTGDVYVSDSNNNTIRKVTRAGVVTTFAGSARATGNVDGSAADARFDDALGIAVDAAGNSYIADANELPDFANAVIRKVSPAGEVNTIAGIPGVTGTGYADGAAPFSRFDFPRGAIVDASGNLYIADTNNGVIRKITPAGMVSTLAGLAGNHGSVDGIGAAARFQRPTAIASDAEGNLYVTDVLHDLTGKDSATIRRITAAGMVTTLAGAAGIGGDDDGAGSTARFTNLMGIAVDIHGNLYVTDASRHTVRKITPIGMVSTLAGSAGAQGDADGSGATARFRGPQGITTDQSGNIYVADTLNNTIRRIATDGMVTTIAGTPDRAGNLPGPLPGSLYRPTGLALNDNDELMVTSAGAILGLKLP